MYRRVPNQIGSGVERAAMGSEDLRQDSSDHSAQRIEGSLRSGSPVSCATSVQSERLYRDLLVVLTLTIAALVVLTLTVVAEAGLARIGIEDLAIVFDQEDRTGS